MSKNRRTQRQKSARDFQEEIDAMGLERDAEAQINRINAISHFQVNKEIKHKNAKQKLLCKTIMENEITFVAGAAGTGKTLLSLKTALELLKLDNDYNQIILTKPIVEAGESIGFLPGDIDSKIDPYMGSFLGNFKKLVGPTKTKDFIENEVIKSVPLAYLRGETFEHSVAIIDEAQNTTVAGLKLWISRKGESSKLIIIGDTDQTDLYLRNGQRSGLDDAFKRFQGLGKIGFVRFTEDEIVRSDILIDIMKRYKIKLED
jgi:phosphate starvation-inducible PhoH-like protein